MKKTISLILSIILLVSLISVTEPVSAADGPKLLAITFDDGPSRYTDELLDGLKERGAKATFFMVGSNVNAFPDTIKRMKDEGHQLATHTMSHANLAKLSVAGIQSEVFGVEERLDNIVGEGEYWLRPPYGSVNATVKGAVKTPIIYWNVDTLDWKSRNAQSVCQTILNQASDGDIILLHDLYKTSVDGALQAIDVLQKRGYVFVTVEKLLKRRGIAPEDGKVYYNVPNIGINLPEVSAPVIAVRKTVVGTKVVIAKSDKEDVVHYTANGATPDKNCDIYRHPYYIEDTQSVKAIAVGESELSDITELTVSLEQALSKAVLDKCFYEYKIPFLSKKTAFKIGMKL